MQVVDLVHYEYEFGAPRMRFGNVTDLMWHPDSQPDESIAIPTIPYLLEKF
jgi:hypothetical protein